MSFLTKLFKKPALILKLEVTLEKNNRKVEIIQSINDDYQKELMLLGSLLIARFLRVIPKNEGKIELAQNFILWYTTFQQQPYSKDLLDTLLNASAIFFNDDTEKSIKKINLVLLPNSNYNIDMDLFYINPLSKVAYFLYQAINENLNLENQINFLDITSLICTNYLQNGLTMNAAIQFPNELVKDNFN